LVGCESARARNPSASKLRWSLLKSEHATVYHHPNDAPLAQTVVDAFEIAYISVGSDLGYPNRKISIYIYDSPEEMVDGLVTILGYDPDYAKLHTRIGATACTKHTMHFLSRIKSWGPLLWHAVAHEYSHGLVEESYGTNASTSMRWLLEGLGDHEAYRTIRTKFSSYMQNWKLQRLMVAFVSLIKGGLPTLTEISTDKEWTNNIRTSRDLWDTQYAEAYVAVTYLIQTYGLDKCKSILDFLKKKPSQEEAVRASLGISLGEFEDAFRKHLLRRGFANFVKSYKLSSVPLAMILTAVVIRQGGSTLRRALSYF